MNLSLLLWRLTRPRALTILMAALLSGACAVAAPPAWAQTAHDFGPVRPLSDVLENMEGAPWSAVRSLAQQQSAIAFGPNYRNFPATVPYYAAFEGDFIPASDDTRLAIFSDDGCDVTINGQRVFNRLDRTQGLSDLTKSLSPLNYEFKAGQSYAIRIEYSNIIPVIVDADGATLFAYTYDENQDRPYVEWRAGNPISCAGIRWPGANATIAPGGEGHVSAFLATDFDQRDATIEGVMTTGVYSDPCSYHWECSAGSFKNGVNTGEAVVWIAPTLAGTYTIHLTVDDQNMANQPTYENGARDDAARGYNDEPLTFSAQVTVQ